MYWAGGCPGRVNRGTRSYPGARRFLQPPQPPVNWRQITSDMVGAILYFSGVLVIILTLILGLG